MRHQIAFRQYNPNKSHQHGLLVKSLNDAELPFTYKTVPNAGKPEAGIVHTTLILLRTM